MPGDGDGDLGVRIDEPSFAGTVSDLLPWRRRLLSEPSSLFERLTGSITEAG